MLIVKLLAGIAFVGSVLWVIAQPDYEPAIAVVTSLSTLIGAIAVDRRRQRRAEQSQVVGERGTAVQAGGDVNIGAIHSSAAKERDVR